MKPLLAITLLLVGFTVANADLLKFKLSPAGTSPAIGLSPSNEVPVVTNSTGSGGEILSGITFDTNTLNLNLFVGYGSALGFTDLTGPATMLHIHGPADATTAAGILTNLAGLHLPAGDPARGGVIFGSVSYTAETAPFLLAGSNYINIHTATNPGGEIRGQLILVTNSPPTIECPTAVTRECTSPQGALVDLAVNVSDVDSNALTVVWTINGIAQQTNAVPAGPGGETNTVHFIANFQVGSHTVGVTVSDGEAAPVSCTTSVTVVDTTPPAIRSISASPATLWPPNHKLVPVTVRIVATDACGGPVTSKIISVTSNEPANGLGDGDTDVDYVITGNLTVNLRAERSGKGKGRIYTIQVESADAANNKSRTTTTVSVPKNKSGRN